jgi:hypothetical protein
VESWRKCLKQAEQVPTLLGLPIMSMVITPQTPLHKKAAE